MTKQPAKRRSVLRERRTRFVQIFRTTPTQTVCPNFYVLAHANGCPFTPRCRYCYLKSSFWHLDDDHAFVNLDAMEQEISRWIRRDGLESYILNMGNLSDSLAFEAERPMAARLIRLFHAEAEAKGRKHTLLMVTKGGEKECRSLFETTPCRNVIVSFSVNNHAAARKFEKGAATVADRMRAARRLKALGWRIRMRIDPMIMGYDYRGIAGQVRKLGPERVTLGSLRAEPNLHRFTENGLFEALEQPADRKALARYPRKQRLALYSQATDILRGLCPIGLCEETPGVWRALGLKTRDKSCNCGS